MERSDAPSRTPPPARAPGPRRRPDPVRYTFWDASQVHIVADMDTLDAYLTSIRPPGEEVRR